MERLDLVVALVVLALEIFCLVGCVLASDAEVRHLPRVVWLLLILIVPLIGSVLWLAVGRERQPRPTVPGPGTPMTARRTYAAFDHDDRIRAMEEDLARLEREADDDERGRR